MKTAVKQQNMGRLRFRRVSRAAHGGASWDVASPKLAPHLNIIKGARQMARIEKLISLLGRTVYAVKVNGIVQSLHASQKEAVKTATNLNKMLANG